MPDVETEAGVQAPNVGQFVITWDVQSGTWSLKFTAPLMATVGQFVDLLDGIKKQAVETDGFKS